MYRDPYRRPVANYYFPPPPPIVPYYGNYDRSYYRYPAPLPVPPPPYYPYGYPPRAPLAPERPSPVVQSATVNQWSKERSDRLHISFKEVETMQELLGDPELDLSKLYLSVEELQLVDGTISDDMVKQYSYTALQEAGLTRYQRAFASHLAQAYKENTNEDLLDTVMHHLLTTSGFADEGLQFQSSISWTYSVPPLEGLNVTVKPDFVVFSECESTGQPAYHLLVDLCKTEDNGPPDDGGQSRIAPRLLGMALANYRNGIFQTLFGIVVFQFRVKIFTVDFPVEYLAALLSEGNIETEIEIKQFPAEQIDIVSQPQQHCEFFDLMSSQSRAELVKSFHVLKDRIVPQNGASNYLSHAVDE